MTPLKLAIVAGRFWPYFGIGEMGVADLASAIKRSGHQVEIITVRWDRSWPRNFTFRENEVVRISQPASGTWGAYRFLRGLTRHVNDANYDGMIVFGLRDESWATLRSCSKQLPILMRLERSDVLPETQMQLNQRQLQALQSVKKILVDSPWTANELTRHNPVSHDAIEIIPYGVKDKSDFVRTDDRQSTVRVALSDAHPILAIGSTQPLVICGAPLDGDGGVRDLVDAWPWVLERHSQARLWILGDGPYGRQIWDRIVDSGLADCIVMPGFFDDLDDIFQAADVYVHPLRSDASCGCLSRAMMAAVCPVSTTTAATHPLIQKKQNGILTSPNHPRALAEAINLALDQRETRVRWGLAARETAQKTWRIETIVDEYLKYFQTSDETEFSVLH